MSGKRSRISRAARMPSSVWVGGMRMSTIATSGLCIADVAQEVVGVAGLCDDLEARVRRAGARSPRAAGPSRRRARRSTPAPSVETCSGAAGSRAAGRRRGAGGSAPAREGLRAGTRPDPGDGVRRARRACRAETRIWPPWPAFAMRDARTTSMPVYPSSPSVGVPVCRPMRTRTRMPARPVGVARVARCDLEAPRSAARARVREGGDVLVADGVRLRAAARRDTVSRSMLRRMRDRVRVARRARRPASAVEPSTSAKRNVTVPVGSAFTGSECISGCLARPAGSRRGSPCRRRPGWRSSSVPSSDGDAVDEPAQARAALRVGAADAVVRHLDASAAVRLGDLDPGRGRLRVLGDVRERLRDHVVRGRLGLGREALARGVDLHRDGRPRRSVSSAGREAAVGEDCRMDAAGELAQLRERLGQLLARAGEQLRCAAAGSDASFDSTSRSETESATSRCCAPSWRFRSSVAPRAILGRARGARATRGGPLRSAFAR